MSDRRTGERTVGTTGGLIVEKTVGTTGATIDGRIAGRMPVENFGDSTGPTRWPEAMANRGAMSPA